MASGAVPALIFVVLSTFDIFLAIPILYGAFKGFRKGLLLELVSLVAFWIALLAGLKLLTSALPVMREYIGDAAGLLPYVTFLIVFVGIVIGIHMGGMVLKKVLDFTPFGFFDNFLGGVLGALKWCFALSLLVYVSGMAGITLPSEKTSDSFIYPIVIKTTPYALGTLGYVLPFAKALLATLKSYF